MDTRNTNIHLFSLLRDLFLRRLLGLCDLQNMGTACNAPFWKRRPPLIWTPLKLVKLENIVLKYLLPARKRQISMSVVVKGPRLNQERVSANHRENK